jgi:hypothetical protein
MLESSNTGPARILADSDLPDQAVKGPRPKAVPATDAAKSQLQRAKQWGQAHQRMLTEWMAYPSHKPRVSTPEYTEIHKQMVKTDGLGCLVCGVTDATLGDPKKNLFGAKQLETHHHIVEWALTNAIDLNAFNAQLLPFLQKKYATKTASRTQDQDWLNLYKSNAPFTQKQMEGWIDHCSHNLWVLCDVHHRAKYVGIHEISYPIWSPQDLLGPNWQLVFPSLMGKLPPGAKKKAPAKAKRRPAAAKKSTRARRKVVAKRKK